MYRQSNPCIRQLLDLSICSTNTSIDTKAAYNNAMCSAAQLLENIKSEPQWEWANNEFLMRPIAKCQMALADVVRSDDFLKVGLAQDISQLRKSMSVEDFERGLRTFSMKLDGPVTNLAREVNMMLRQQEARQAVE